MNRSLLFSLAGVAALFAAASCSQAGPSPSSVASSGGNVGSGGVIGNSGAPTASGGATTGPGTGGLSSGGAVSGTGGTTSTGGIATGTGGAATTGGTSATTGGALSSGGAGKGGADTAGATGSGGATSGGSSTGGATAAGAAGASTGGSSTGGAATGGTGSAGAAGAGDIPVASIVPTLDGYLWIGTCASGSAASLDCTINNDANQCPNPNAAAYADRGAFRNFTHNVGGTTGTKYTVNFEVRGVAGGRCYAKDPAFPGIRSSTLIADPEGAAGNDGWFVGGTPTDSKWNTYEFHVTPPVPGAANVYYFNAFPSTSGLCERHETFVFKYSASFPVLGGGSIKAVIHDSNCLGQQNCGGVDNQPMCSTPRTIDLSGMSPPPPASFVQPLAQAASHPQWLFFDVKTVTSP